MNEKLSLITCNLRPVPFPLSKFFHFSFSKHESLLRSLGLWDFVHLRLDCNIRCDLLALLIANYDPATSSSDVNNARIKIGRSALAHALGLPTKKVASEPFDLPQESLSFLLEFLQNYVLLHGDDWTAPDEVLAAVQDIKSGRPQNVGWAGLVWGMVKKELLQVAELPLFCYYASHLQHLMKSQQPELFRLGAPKSVEEVLVEEEEEDGNIKATATEKGLEDLSKTEQNVEKEQQQQQQVLCLKQCSEQQDLGSPICNMDAAAMRKKLEGLSEREQIIKKDEEVLFFKKCSEKHSMEDFEDISKRLCIVEEKEVEKLEECNRKQGVWSPIHNGEIDGSSHFPAHCSLTKAKSIENESKQEEERDLLQSTLRGLQSSNANVPKQEMKDLDDSHQHVPVSAQLMNLRSDGKWNDAQMGSEMCPDQVKSWLDKARMMYREKEASLQTLCEELDRQNEQVQTLMKSKQELKETMRMYIYRLERELCVMTQLVTAYKGALKETRSEFTEYRKRFQHLEEPLYKDIGGSSGGLVLSVREFENQGLGKNQEEKKVCSVIQEKVEAFQQSCMDKFDFCVDKIELLDKRLLGIMQEAKILRK